MSNLKSPANESCLVPTSEQWPRNFIDEDDNTETYIIHIPRSLVEFKHLNNEEIIFGGKKPSKVTIRNKQMELVTQQLLSSDRLPWLVDHEGILEPLPRPLDGEVRARLVLLKPGIVDPSKCAMDILRPAQHTLPDLPIRNFFGAHYGSAVKGGSSKDSKSDKKTKKVKTIESSSVSGKQAKKSAASHQVQLQGQNETAAVTNASPSKKRKRSLEDLSPEMLQKPFKRKKQDKLVQKFNSVYKDICNTPSKDADQVNAVIIDSMEATNGEIKLSSSSKKSKKTKKGKESN